MLPEIVNLQAELARFPILIGARHIVHGDEAALRPAELCQFARAVETVRRQSGAARTLARGLLRQFGIGEQAIPKLSSGAPAWPPGIVGSLAHNETIAVAAVGRTCRLRAIGIDIEADEPLADDIAELVATPTERSRYDRSLLRRRHLFVAKEAVFKASHPIDGVFLEFHDVEVDFEGRCARTSYGRTVHLDVASGSHVVALARIEA